MSLSGLGKNYQNPLPSVENMVRQIVLALIPAFQEISCHTRSVDAYYCSRYEFDRESIGNDRIEIFHHYEDLGSYRDAILQYDRDIEGRSSGIRKIFTQEEMKKIVSSVETELKRNGLRNCRVWEEFFSMNEITYGSQNNGALSQFVREQMFGRSSAVKTKLFTTKIPGYAIRIKASW